MGNEKEQKIRDKKSSQDFSIDEDVLKVIQSTETQLSESLNSVKIDGMNGFQRKQIYQHFEKNDEYKVKSYKENDDVRIKIFPVGNLKRLAEMKTQEVIMNGKAVELPPMGSYERYVVHDYLKERDGIKTESFGGGMDRYIKIIPLKNIPLFGRMPKKAKKKLTI